MAGPAADALPDVARSAIAKASWRIIPLLGLGYLVAYMDRVNIGFAATRMNDDLHFSATIYRIGAAAFFLSYALFEVPSNLLLVRFGARRWIARIMVSWGLLAMAMALVAVPWHFYVLRFLLGFAEAGFFPGVVYHMAHWFPLEAPATVPWLSPPEKDWLTGELAADAARLGPAADHSIVDALRDPLVFLLGVIGFLCISCFYALTLSAPTLLLGGTGWDITRVGYIVGLGGVLGAASMLVTGWMTDRSGDRFPVLLLCTALVSLAYASLGWGGSPAVVIGAYLLFATAWAPVTSSHVQLWADVLQIRKLAVGCAAINSMSQIGAAISPWLWGWAKDATGGYGLALTVMSVAMLLALAVITMLRARVRGQIAPAALAVAP
ncbi:MAG TPA: MFS transporter [Sphingomonas sp.]|nr:MFS transporter [Sphingomonas sp.]